MKAPLNRGQSISEFAVILGAVMLAFSLMTIYVKRAAQAKIKIATDDLFHLITPEGEDLTGERTQRKGIEAAIPNTLPPDGMNPAEYTAKVTSDGQERYSRGGLTVTSNTTIETTGKEVYREFIGQSDSSSSDASSERQTSGSSDAPARLGYVRER